MAYDVTLHGLTPVPTFFRRAATSPRRGGIWITLHMRRARQCRVAFCVGRKMYRPRPNIGDVACERPPQNSVAPHGAMGYDVTLHGLTPVPTFFRLSRGLGWAIPTALGCRVVNSCHGELRPDGRLLTGNRYAIFSA